MPTVNAKDGCPINYQVEGPASAPVLMLCNSLGTDLHMWDDQAPEWSKHFRLVRYDRRGHGQSGAPKGPYTMDMLGNDALAVADAAGAKTFNWCGLSMGGMVGQELALRHPALVAALFVGLTALGVSPAAQAVVGVLIAILVGCEGGSLRRFSLRRRWTQVGVVAARDLEEAERRFFESWDGSATSVPPAAAWAPSMPVAPASPDVLGLFPQPGPRG